MLKFILNKQTIETDLPKGMTVLDFVRYHKNLKGTKIGCREGDCGACTILIGELKGERVEYRSMTSCLTPLANADGKHIVTVEGINPENGDLTPVQNALVEQSGTQCGFCTVGFVMSMTGFCLDETPKTNEMAVSAVDGNICRCTGYKSIERACERLAVSSKQFAGSLESAIQDEIVPPYFADIKNRLEDLANENTKLKTLNSKQTIVGGGTDLYVQKHDEMVYAEAEHIFYDDDLRNIKETGEYVEIGASVTVTDLLESKLMQEIFPDLYKHLKLVSSTPIRNMATLAGNFINASPIGDMTVWFLALDAEIDLSVASALADASSTERTIPLKDLYLGYKDLAKSEDETIKTIRFKKPVGDFYFNFEKVCKRTYLDIATVNTAISLSVASASANALITEAHIAAGGVSPIPLYLRKTSAYLVGKKISEETILNADDIMQTEISPISDVRGSKEYKRLLLRQLFTAHFVELFGMFEE